MIKGISEREIRVEKREKRKEIEVMKRKENGQCMKKRKRE